MACKLSCERVRKAISGQTTMYIIPMCAKCNSSSNKNLMNPNQGTRAAIVYPQDIKGPPNVCTQQTL